MKERKKTKGLNQYLELDSYIIAQELQKWIITYTFTSVLVNHSLELKFMSVCNASEKCFL